MNCKWKIN